MKQPFESSAWRLFIDGNKTSIKAVLLHNGNEKPSIPIAYAVGYKEEYDTLKEILSLIQYNRFKFKIVADYKVIAILMGLQTGYTAHCCYLCLWHSRKDDEHFVRNDWPKRLQYTPGINNVKGIPLVSNDNIIPPPLHIKLGLFRNFVKALGTRAVEYLIRFFPKVSYDKVTKGVFNGPQIREIMKNEEFKSNLTTKELAAYEAFIKVVQGFLGNHRDPNAKRLVEDLLKKYHAMGSRMSLKMHFLKSHFDSFPDNLGKYSDEHGEKFHQNMFAIESRFNNRFHTIMLGEYCWNLLRDSSFVYSRQASTRHF